VADAGGTDRPRAGDGTAEAQIRTFLIADVRGYTLFTQERGDEAAAKLAAKFADIAREIVEARGGTLLELRGDEALCVFASTREAIRAAVDLQQRFVQETLDQPELPLTVGIGLDAGEAVPVQGGYRGAALNLAARLCGQARAGEILATREVTHLARRVEGLRYEGRGSLTFKGISDPVVVVRVVPEAEDPVERLRPFAPAPTGPRRTPTRRWAIVGTAALVLLLLAISIPLLTFGDDAAERVGANSVARMSAVDGAVQLAAALDERPGASAVGFGSLWVTHPDRGTVSRLDLEDGHVEDTIRVGQAPSGIAVGEGSVWVTNAGDGTVSRISPETNEASDTLNVGAAPSGIAVGDGSLWVGETISASLLRVDPISGDIEPTELDGQPAGVAYTPDGVWVSTSPSGIARVSPSDGSVTLTQTVGSGPTGVAAAFGSVWVSNHLDGTVTRLEPSTGHPEATIPVGDGPNALVAAGDRLWVANEFEGSVDAIDPAANAVEQSVPVGGAAAALATDGEDLWLATGASPTEHRGGTVVVATEVRLPNTLDPAVVYDPIGWQILSVTNDGLLAYEKVGGPDGSTLVPDLASALPQVSPDGLSYRFPLRDGLIYSNGDPIAPEDFRRGLERSLALTREAQGLFGAIEGADACGGKPPSCDLSDSILVDEESVTYRLSFPDGELPFKLAMPFAFPVPADTPMEDQGLVPVPATGPYMVDTAEGDSIDLIRNPRFEEWSAAAQPDGFVDRISWRFDMPLPAAFEQVTEGGVDVMFDAPGADELATLEAAHPDQVVRWPQPATIFVGFDVLKPPFDDVRVRQAVNYAIDRELIIELFGGRTGQRPTCQILPPNFQGYAPFCPYTVDPGTGTWTAPDLDRARELIEEAGAVGQEVIALVAEVGLPEGAVDVMEHVVEVLNELGLRARPEIVEEDRDYFGMINAVSSPDHPEIYMSGWISDYPGAANFIQAQFACGGFANSSGLCDDELDAAIEEALALNATDPGAANRAWIDIEHSLVEDAQQAPLVNFVATHAISARTENVQINPQWGILLSRLWVR
jgi:YVTN family beta-propeller protein